QRQFARGPHDFRQPAARKSAGRERIVERIHAGGHSRRLRQRRGQQSSKRIEVAGRVFEPGDQRLETRRSGLGTWQAEEGSTHKILWKRTRRNTETMQTKNSS